MLVIDGAHGEGGGQILRSSLALSLATGTPFRIHHIRAGRAKPGLLRQHLTSVEAARTIGDATVDGAVLRSPELTFIPGAVRPGAYRFDIGSAGSTLLVIQALLPALLVNEGWFELTVEGGTHNPAAPTYDYFARVLVPILSGLGARVEPALGRPGFYPAGGGKVRLTVEGLGGRGRLAPLELLDRGDVHTRSITALLSNLPRHIGEREIAAARARLGWDPAVTAIIDEARAHGAGNAVTIEVGAAHVTELFTAIGGFAADRTDPARVRSPRERGVPAETVAERAADDAAAWLAAGVPVGEHLADQLLVPLALGRGGRFRTTPPSLHTTTQIDLLRQFLGIEVRAAEVAPAVWEIDVPGSPG